MNRTAGLITALWIALTAAASSIAYSASPAADGIQHDPLQWLEEPSSPQALAWVRDANRSSLPVLEGDARYPKLHAEALALVEAGGRIPWPDFIGGEIYNFWQDAAHPKGLWRRTSLGEYAKAQPTWETMLDLDALAATEGVNWVWKGMICERRHNRRCLVQLSIGGEDAVRLREIDLQTKRLIEGGFDLPRGKQSVDWLDEDTLLVARDWGPGTMTPSGYAFVAKAWKRGQPLSSAVEIHRAAPSDLGVEATTFVSGDGRRVTLLRDAVTTFDNRFFWVRPDGTQRLKLPSRAQVVGVVEGRLILKLTQDWTVTGRDFTSGSIVAISLEDAAGLTARAVPELVFAPRPRQSVQQATVTPTHVVAAVLDNVRGRVYSFRRGTSGWAATQLPIPDNLATGIVAAGNKSASDSQGRFFVLLSGFLTPTTLSLADAATARMVEIKALPPQFDASQHVVEQHQALSPDGAQVPYFLVRPRKLTRGGAPTLVEAYGGFGVSRLPTYSAPVGKLWLEKGGVYVLANVRGGGELGPEWHQSAIKTDRLRSYEDFTAVARDLIRRGIADPDRLGMRGGSNGALLMGVQLTQHPELWRAAILGVPILDMMRFENMGAGASWAGEYGSNAVPAERAFLASVSPYHQLRPGVPYPQPFIYTATSDDRAGPGHARKFAARLQALGQPALFYENTNGGHAAAADAREAAHLLALEMTYLAQRLMD